MEKKLEQLDEWFEKQIAFCAEEQRKLLDYDKAKAHGDIEQMQIENIKLETIQEIKLKFSEIWEEKR